jgi:ubiquinone/menaquinone biosynthesis C-methylase UbiE
MVASSERDPMSAATTTIRERFSAEAGNWDKLYSAEGPSSIYEHNLWKRRSTALEFVGSASGRALDVGCGPGNVTLALPDTAEVLATDFAIPMLREAQKSAVERKKAVDLAASDATALPYLSGSVETVTALGLLEYVPESEEVLKEMARVLSPGGTLVISSPNAKSPFIIIDDALKAIKNTITQTLLPAALRRRLKSLIGKEDTKYFTHKRHRFNPSAIAEQLNELGFDVVEHRYHTFGFGVLDRVRLNLALCEKLESWAHTHPNLEKLGWTIVLKAKKRS